MAKAFRAKLVVQSVTDWGYNDIVSLQAQYTTTPEDNSYSAATPSAKAEFTISNPAPKDTIKPGDAFYVDFTPIEKPPVAGA